MTLLNCILTDYFELHGILSVFKSGTRSGLACFYKHWVLPRHPMPFVFFVLIYLLLSLCLHKMKHISHALHHQNTQTKGMG